MLVFVVTGLSLLLWNVLKKLLLKHAVVHRPKVLRSRGGHQQCGAAPWQTAVACLKL